MTITYRNLGRTAATALLAAAPLALVLAPAHAAPAPSAAPSYSCTIDGSSTVVGADYLKVHTSPSTSSPAVGQLKRNTVFHLCNSSLRKADGYYWYYGYGNAGSTRLTGWVVTRYLAGP